VFGLFDRKKMISPQEVAAAFVEAQVNVCKAEREEWRNTFIGAMESSGWVSEELPENIDRNRLQWILIASVMALECMVIKNVFNAKDTSHLYDAVYVELEKLGSISGMENLGDIVFGLMAQAENDRKELLLRPTESIVGGIINYFGFHPPEGEVEIFNPIPLMSLSSKLLKIGGFFWKPISENYNIKV